MGDETRLLRDVEYVLLVVAGLGYYSYSKKSSSCGALSKLCTPLQVHPYTAIQSHSCWVGLVRVKLGRFVSCRTMGPDNANPPNSDTAASCGSSLRGAYRTTVLTYIYSQ